jgi:hypothetical protein
MADYSDVNPEIAERIKAKILVKEQMNIKQKVKSDKEMVKTIISIIQDEVKSYSPVKRT